MNFLDLTKTEGQYFKPTHILTDKGWSTEVGNANANWLDDVNWCMHIDCIVKVTDDMAAVFFAGSEEDRNYGENTSPTLYKGRFNI